MSIRIMTLVWEYSQHKEGDLLTMLAIADHSDDKGRAFPAMERLAKKTRLSRRHLQRVIRNLEKSEELKILRNAGPHRTHLFQINIDALKEGRQNVHGQNVQVDNMSIDISCLRPGHSYVHQTVIEPSVEKQKQDLPQTGEIAYSKNFLTFWAVYPHKKGKRDAWQVWQRLKLDSRTDELVASVIEHKKKDAAWKGGFVCYPAVYLRQGRWEDDLDSQPEKDASTEKSPAYHKEWQGHEWER